MFSKILTRRSIENFSDKIQRLKKALDACDTLLIGAGAGLSTSAGFVYSGERFQKYFHDFSDKYGIADMYSGGFYPFPSEEEQWAFWSRNIYINRYQNPPKPVYETLFSLIKSKDYFVITTNVDHCFQKSGFDKKRLFYTQGDYGLWQCSEPCHQETYDNEDTVRKMLTAQGYTMGQDGTLVPPEKHTLKMEIPSALKPRCPRCGKPMRMNLRADDTFVENNGWHQAAERYAEFLRRHRETKTLFLELGVGGNTPAIIKYPFWRMTYEWPDALYACLNYGEALAPQEIKNKSVCLDGDIGEILDHLQELS